MSRTRRGVSPLFVVGLILWACVFVGLFVMRYANTKEEKPNPANIPGAIPEDPALDTPVAGQGGDGTNDDTEDPDDPDEPRTIDITPALTTRELQEFELVERSGRKVTRADLLGKPFVAGFIFTRCQTHCPIISKQIYDLQSATKSLDMRYVSISCDPTHDTPEVLARYAENFDAHPDRWLYLTGEEREIFGLVQRSFGLPAGKVPDPEPGGREYGVIHSRVLIYVDAEGVVRDKYDAYDADAMRELKARLGREVPRIEAEPTEDADAATE